MRIEVRVKAGTKRDRIFPAESSSKNPAFVVELKAQAQDGKANAALIKLLAKHFGVTQSEVSIKRGKTSKIKFIEVTS